MELYRIWAVALRHLRHIQHDFSRLTVLLYWPFEEIILWGYSGLWVQGDQGLSHVGLSLLLGAVLWQVAVRANYDISLNLLEEILSHNVSNIFSTPLLLSEWIIAVILLAGITLGAMVLFLSLLVWFLYSVSLLSLGLSIIPMLVNLFFSGLSIGFFSASLLIFWGIRIEALVYMIGWIFAPFSGVYYELHVLPVWAQWIARMLPMSYIFDGIRLVVTTGHFPSHQLGMSFTLNLCYFVLSLIFFKIMFERSRRQGLSRLVT